MFVIYNFEDTIECKQAKKSAQVAATAKVENAVLASYQPPISFRDEPDNAYIVESLSMPPRNRFGSTMTYNNNKTAIVLNCAANKLQVSKYDDVDLKVKWFRDNVDLEKYSSDFNNDFEK